MRMYDPRLCRFPNVDPITADYPELTPYQFASNTPIQAIDLDGLEQYNYNLVKKDGKAHLELVSVEEDWIDFLQPYAVYINYGEHTLRFTTSQPDPAGNGFNVSQIQTFVDDPDAFIAEADKMRSEFVWQCAIGGAMGLSEKAPGLTGVFTTKLRSTAKPNTVSNPTEAYNRSKHYGKSPTSKDRKDLGAKDGQDIDHTVPLVKHYYEGDGKGGKPGYSMTQEERRKFANDQSKMKVTDSGKNRSDGGKLTKYSKEQKKKYFGKGKLIE